MALTTTEDTQTITDSDVASVDAASLTGDGAEAAKPKRTRNLPTYGLSKVDSLPDDIPSSRADLYFNLLTDVQADPGEWYCVATFHTPTGAATVAKELKEGKRNIPKGEWEFQARKVPNEENRLGQKWSKLYARYMGDGTATQ